MNVFGFSLGALLLLKTYSANSPRPRLGIQGLSWPRNPGLWLAVVSLLFLAYIGLHGLNAKGRFDSDLMVIKFAKSYLSWLPHTYDSHRTWSVFWQYSALLAGFWATRSWLQARNPFGTDTRPNQNPKLGARRARLLLITLTINACILALVGIAQRMDGNEMILWVYTPVFKATDSHFGSYVYRGNAAAYFNLVWPTALALLMWSRAERRADQEYGVEGGGLYPILYPMLILLVSVPLISNSRAGAAVTLVIIGLMTLLFVFRSRHKRWKTLVGIVLLIATVGLIAYQLGASTVVRRVSQLVELVRNKPGQIERLDIYRYSIQIHQNDQLWGVGPGAFSSVFGMLRGTRYSVSDNEAFMDWCAWAHSDPLETVITFGYFGASIVAAWFALLFLHPRFNRLKAPLPTSNLALAAALFGCCTHSVVDFPFQIYSLLHAFLVIAALYTCGISFEPTED